VAQERDQDGLDRLVRKARSGSGAAFTELWELFNGPVEGYVRGLGVPDAEDVTSEAFLAAFASIGSFRGDGEQFRSWLFSIAHRRAVDDRRRRTRRGSDLAYDAVDDPREVSSAEAEALTQLEARDCLHLLSRLPRDQREVVFLRVMGGQSADQAGERLARSGGAVRQLQRRALDRLRRELSDRAGIAARRDETPVS
jgi:RNA polymerase sigma-70 factor (ECF subfamily)